MWYSNMLKFINDYTECIENCIKEMSVSDVKVLYIITQETRKRYVLLKMTKELKKIKREAVKTLGDLEKRINSASIETEDAFIDDFCRRHEKRIIFTSEAVKSHIAELNKTYIDIITYKYLLDKEDFKNKLTAAIFQLEFHLDKKKAINPEVKLLQTLGKQNEFVNAIATCLEKGKELKPGFEEPIDINKELRSSIDKAILAAFIKENKGLGNYIIRYFVSKIFGSFGFRKNIAKFVLKDTELSKDLRHLRYLEEAIKKRKYEDALKELQALSVLFVIIEIGAYKK